MCILYYLHNVHINRFNGFFVVRYSITSMTKWATGMITLRNTVKHYLRKYESVIYISLCRGTGTQMYGTSIYVRINTTKKWNLLPIKCFDFFSQKKFRMSVENDPMWNPLSLDPLSVDIPTRACYSIYDIAFRTVLARESPKRETP